VLSLFAVTSSPLMLGNDARPGRMQQRLVDLLTNPDLLAVNSYYSQKERNAGGRIWSGPVGKELWAKPLAGGSTAVVLLNRAGLASGNALGVRNPYFAPYAGCFDLHGRADAILAPCDDNATASHGAQSIALNLSAIPRSWLGLAEEPNVDSALESTLSCEVFDILATAKAGASLGPQKDSAWAPVVPPHGVRFVRVSNCTESRSRRLKTDDQTATVASAPRNPDRIKGEYMWCECGTGSRSVTVWPTGQRNLSVAVRAAAPLPNFIDFGRTVQRVSWLCDGMKAPKELYFSGAVKSKWWWTASLPIPLAGGLPTHPVGCSQDRDTGRLHLAAWQDLPADGDSVSSVVFATGEGPPSVPKPYACIKIPVLLYTAKRTLLAIAEARLVSCSDGAQTDLIVKRSTDNGRSWSHAAILRSSPGDTIGNAAPVQLRTVQQPHLDRIIVPHTRNNSDVWVTESDDDGMTFSKARLLPNVSRDGWNWVGTGPPGSIEVTGGEHAGRLVVPCYHSEDRANNNIAHGHVMLSDDQGATFRLGFVQPAADDKHWNECQVAQLSDGHLLVNARSLANPLEHQQRIQAISTDGGETFGPTRYIPELPQPINGCEGSMVVAAEHNNNSSSSSTKQLLLLSGPDSKLLRTGMVIWWSADGGESWRKALDVDPGTSGYSSLQFMPAAETGTEAVGLLYEQSDGVEVVMTPDRFIFRRFSLPVLDAGRNAGRNS
jgi:sialidase-1